MWGLVASPKRLHKKRKFLSHLTLPHTARGEADCESQPSPVPPRLFFRPTFKHTNTRILNLRSPNSN